jgi:transposase-like protein
VRKQVRRQDAGIVEVDEVLAEHVAIELPVRLVDVIQGVSAEIEQLAGQAGLLIMQAVMDAEVVQLAGLKGRHQSDQPNSRWGSQRGCAVLGGRKVALRRPRVRTDDGCEVPLQSYARFQSPPRRQTSIVRQLVHGISTRKYERAIERFTDGYGVSKSAVSREWVTATSGSLRALCERRIDQLPPIAVLLIDGVEYAGECIVIALGVDARGQKHVLGLVQGATENAVVVQQLLDELMDRGLDAEAKRLYVLDGSKALRKAVRRTFGERSPVQRCQVHKRRNLKRYLSPEYERTVDQRLMAAYAMKDYAQARKLLLGTVEWLKGINPSAAASLRDGLEETLTLHRLQCPELLRRSFSSTNIIESAISVVRTATQRVKRWRGGDMRLRWSAAGLLATEKRFRRVRGYKSMATLVSAIETYDPALAGKQEAA